MLGSNCEMCDTFWALFSDCFAHCADLLVQEFHSYLADFPCLLEAETASCKGLVTECEVCDAGRPEQIARTGWFALQSVLEDVAHVCPYSDMYSNIGLPKEPSLVA